MVIGIHRTLDAGHYEKHPSFTYTRTDAGLHLHTLKDDPECDTFRLQLAKLAQGSPYDGRTAPQMTQVLRKARAAGCHK